MRIVLISLKRATERRRRMAEEFARVGLDYEIWPAKDARTLTDEDRAFVDRAARERLGLYPIPDGSLANTLSQRAAMRDLVRNGPDMMAVFEDDARFEPSLPTVLQELQQRPAVFDIIKLQRRNPGRPFVPTIPLDTGHRLGRVRFSDYGSDGYVITREAARLLLNELLEWFGRLIRSFLDFGTAASTFFTLIPRSFGRMRWPNPKSKKLETLNTPSIAARGGTIRRYSLGASSRVYIGTSVDASHFGGFYDRIGPPPSPAPGSPFSVASSNVPANGFEDPFRRHNVLSSE